MTKLFITMSFGEVLLQTERNGTKSPMLSFGLLRRFTDPSSFIISSHLYTQCQINPSPFSRTPNGMYPTCVWTFRWKRLSLNRNAICENIFLSRRKPIMLSPAVRFFRIPNRRNFHMKGMSEVRLAEIIQRIISSISKTSRPFIHLEGLHPVGIFEGITEMASVMSLQKARRMKIVIVVGPVSPRVSNDARENSFFGEERRKCSIKAYVLRWVWVCCDIEGRDLESWQLFESNKVS